MLDVIRSPFIVSVMSMVDAPDGGISIIMEYMEFGNLRHFTPLFLVAEDAPGIFRSECWARRMRMICEMLKGLNFLHTLKPNAIFHRDLKLENIFVGQGYIVKVFIIYTVSVLLCPHIFSNNETQ